MKGCACCGGGGRLTSIRPAVGSAQISPSRGTHPCQGEASGRLLIGHFGDADQNMPHISLCGCLQSFG